MTTGITTIRANDSAADSARQCSDPQRLVPDSRTMCRPGGFPMNNRTALDQADIALLRVLEADARVSFSELGERVGLSKSPCWARVRALEQTGIIRGYFADLDPSMLGLEVRAWVQITVNARKHAEFEAAVLQHPNVIECYTAAGAADYLLQILVADIAALDGLLRGDLAKLPGVERVATTVCLKTIKSRSGIMPCVKRPGRG